MRVYAFNIIIPFGRFVCLQRLPDTTNISDIRDSSSTLILCNEITSLIKHAIIVKPAYALNRHHQGHIAGKRYVCYKKDGRRSRNYQK